MRQYVLCRFGELKPTPPKHTKLNSFFRLNSNMQFFLSQEYDNCLKIVDDFVYARQPMQRNGREIYRK